MKVTPTLPKRYARRMAWTGLTALVLVFALSAAPLSAIPRMELLPYYSVVSDKPFAPFTASEGLQSTSLLPYYSVVRDKPFAPFTTRAELRRTSLVPYYSVLH